MTIVDNSKIFHEGIYGDATVTVPAKTTYQAGLVLAHNVDKVLKAYSTDNDTATFTSEPTYFLAQDIVNEENSAVDYPLARVFECGTVNVNKINFVKAEDATNAIVLAKLKNNGFNLVNIQELS